VGHKRRRESQEKNGGTPVTVREISITALNFDSMKPEQVFEWLELFGFNRYPLEYYIPSQKISDPRYAHRFNPLGKREIKGCMTPAMIVPYYYYGETMFIIRKSEYDRIKEQFLKAVKP